MSNTPTTVCSNALIKLGDDPITALTENSQRARHCNRLFEPTRKAVQRLALWNDSRKRVQLAQLSDTPVWEWAYAFALPTDYIRMVASSLDENKEPYAIEGRTLLTNEASVYLTYIYDNQDVSTYDDLHIDALTSRMAYELAEPITGKKSSGQVAAAEYEAKLRDAKAIDGQEDTSEVYTDSTLTDTRR